MKKLMCNKKRLVSEQLKQLSLEEQLISQYETSLLLYSDSMKFSKNNKAILEASTKLKYFPNTELYSDLTCLPSSLLEDITEIHKRFELNTTKILQHEEFLEEMQTKINSEYEKLDDDDMIIFDQLFNQLPSSKELQQEYNEYIHSKGLQTKINFTDKLGKKSFK